MIVKTGSWVIIDCCVDLFFLYPGEEPLEEFAPPEPLYPSSDSEYPPVVLDNGSIQYSAPFGDSDVISDFPIDSDSPIDSDYTFPILESGDMGGRPGKEELERVDWH